VTATDLYAARGRGEGKNCGERRGPYHSVSWVIWMSEESSTNTGIGVENAI